MRYCFVRWRRRKGRNPRSPGRPQSCAPGPLPGDHFCPRPPRQNQHDMKFLPGEAENGQPVRRDGDCEGRRRTRKERLRESGLSCCPRYLFTFLSRRKLSAIGVIKFYLPCRTEKILVTDVNGSYFMTECFILKSSWR